MEIEVCGGPTKLHASSTENIFLEILTKCRISIPMKCAGSAMVFLWFYLHTFYKLVTDQVNDFLLLPATKLGQGRVFTGVCDSVNRGVSASVHAGIPHPLEQTPPTSRHSPEQTPPGADPPEQTSPQEQTPPWSRHPPRADTPPPGSRACLGIRSTRGWYSSYWNAILFFFLSFFHTVLFFRNTKLFDINLINISIKYSNDTLKYNIIYINSLIFLSILNKI